MRYLGIAVLVLCVGLQTFNYYGANERANMWKEKWKTDTTSLLNTDRTNRTTIMRQQCLLEKSESFTRQINHNLEMGRLRPVDAPDFEPCMKLEAKPILEETSASR